MWGVYTAIILANMEQYNPSMFRLNIKTGPVYTVKEQLSVDGTCLHCKCSFTVSRRVHVYVNTKFPYYSIFIIISAMF